MNKETKSQILRALLWSTLAVGLTIGHLYLTTSIWAPEGLIGGIITAVGLVIDAIVLILPVYTYFALDWLSTSLFHVQLVFQARESFIDYNWPTMGPFCVLFNAALIFLWMRFRSRRKRAEAIVTNQEVTSQ